MILSVRQCGEVDVWRSGNYWGTEWRCWPYHPGAQFPWTAFAAIFIAIVAAFVIVTLATTYFNRRQR